MKSKIVGRTNHIFGTTWYNTRKEVLKRLGLEHSSRPEILQNYKDWLKLKRRRMNNTKIGELAGLTTGQIAVDCSKIGLTAPNNNKDIIPPTSLKFDDDPYSIASMQFSYNKETGEIRHKAAWGRLSLRKVGHIVNVDEQVVCKSRNVTYKQLVWILHTKEMPEYNLGLIDEYLPVIFSNLKYIKNHKALKANESHETIIVNGRQHVLTVDSSRSTQPDTQANKYRMARICYQCHFYLDRCLESEMTLRCAVSAEERAAMAPQGTNDLNAIA